MAERLQRSTDLGHSSLVPLCVEGDDGIEQEIGCSRSSLWSGGGSSGFSHAHHAAAVAEATGDDGGVEGVEVGLSGEGGIEGGELLGGVEEHARDRGVRSEEHTSELQSLMRIPYAV